LKLAKWHLNNAQKNLKTLSFAVAVGETQLCIENAAKAIISCFQIPSWSHDPSEELFNVTRNNQAKITELFGAEFIKRLKELAETASEYAENHGKTVYGDFARRIPPWRIYTRKNAETALKYAGEAYKVAKKFVKAWYALDI